MPYRTVPETHYVAHLCHIVRGQAVCSFLIRRSSVRARWRQAVFAQVSGLGRPRDLPEPPLSSSPVAHLWHIVTDRRHVPCTPAQSAGAGRSSRHRHRDRERHLRTRTRDQSMTTHIMTEEDVCRRRWGCETASGRASADSVPSPTRLPRSLQSGLKTSREDRSVGPSRRVV